MQKNRILQLVGQLQELEQQLMVSEWCITNLSMNVGEYDDNDDNDDNDDKYFIYRIPC